jgi:hypothetical protein
MSKQERGLAKLPLLKTEEASSIKLTDLISKTIDFLKNVEKGKAFFDNGPWIFNWSTTSDNKRYFALQSFSTGVIPILKPTSGLEDIFGVAELSAKDGRIAAGDELKQLTFEVPEIADFRLWPVKRQVEIQALVKAIGDPSPHNTEIHTYIMATDCRGCITLPDGKHHLDKTKVKEEQKTTLRKIFNAGVIEGAVGVAIGHREPFQREEHGDEWTYRWSQRHNFHTATQEVKVYLIPISDEKIDEYIAKHYDEICKSGWVLNVLGKWCREQHLVKSFELENIEDPGTFREATFAEAAPVIAGYPVELIQKLLKKTYPKGNYSDNQPELKKKLHNVARFLNLI